MNAREKSLEEKCLTKGFLNEPIPVEFCNCGFLHLEAMVITKKTGPKKRRQNHSLTGRSMMLIGQQH